MKLGIDGKKMPEAARRGPITSFDHARALGMEGLFFRTVLDMSPTLDLGLLRDIRAKADSLGMYVETGLGKVNPYALPETPEVRIAGGGDVLLGFERMMRACAEVGCRELWVALANYKTAFVGKFSTDRFRTDVTWAEQLAASERLLRKLAPMARDLGLHLNLETHEEASTFEIVRLVEAVGPDVVGVVLDTANVLQRSEHPVYAARRVAPYVRQTHIKDALVALGPEGIEYQMRPCGAGVVDFDAILPLVAAVKPDLNLSIENDQSFEDRPREPVHMRIDVHDPDWRAAHPDLSQEEFDAFMALAEEGSRRIDHAEVPSFDAWRARRPGYAGTVEDIQATAAHVRAICARHGLPLDPCGN
ncbi:sugar phosphate isomerase/epimerase family protein [Hydrogenophaga sp. 2FB]|uniref:sugar phosphate isomerase/epimerase family protein n=1 Tax=Hydrogenophaga sp. 2FB TaxID=2502187 RepID=UPI0010F87131|nr:sugar phosphate isomerase/epimerase family protein [Hydrogenophaga sp. 2FB]